MTYANAVRYRAPGPVAARFVRDRSFVSVINGPVGGGKTTAGFMKYVHVGCQQQRSLRDGYRYFKLCIVRDTYRQLWKSTIPSWFKRFPETEGDWVGSKDAPARHRLNFDLADGSRVKFETEFLAIGDNSVEEVLRGYEPTAFLLEEVDTLQPEVLLNAITRVGRFPDMDHGGPSWRGIGCTLNAPTFENWTYPKFWLDLPEGWALFRQPSGLSPQAENLANLPAGYYQQMMSGMPDWMIDRLIRNKPGISRSGKPIYPEFIDTLHVADHKLEPLQGLPLLLGLDAGGSPAAVITQRLQDGQWRVYRELVAEQGTGPRRFGRMLAQLLHEEFPQWGVAKPREGWETPGAGQFSAMPVNNAIRGWADPSAAYGADRVSDEMDWIEMVAAELRIRIEPAPTNNPSPRWEAVRTPLSRLIDGRPGFLLCPKGCPKIRAGFNAGYRFRKKRLVGERDSFSEEADKNEYSHPHDGLQYVMLAGGENFAIRGRQAAMQSAGQMRAITEWDPFSHG